MDFPNDDTAEMLAPKNTVHWVGACEKDHALISCTIDEQVLSYQDPWARDLRGRTEAIKAEKFDPKQILRIQSKLDAIMRPIAKQIITDIKDGQCIKEMGLRCVVESRVATAGMLMRKNPLGTDNRARERSPHRSQEQVERISNVDSCTNNSRKARPSIRSSSAMHGTIQTLQRFQDYTAKSEEGGQSPGMDDSTESDNQILVSRSSIQSDEARTVESASAGSTGAQGFPGRASRQWQVFR